MWGNKYGKEGYLENCSVKLWVIINKYLIIFLIFLFIKLIELFKIYRGK